MYFFTHPPVKTGSKVGILCEENCDFLSWNTHKILHTVSCIVINKIDAFKFVARSNSYLLFSTFTGPTTTVDLKFNMILKSKKTPRSDQV